MISPTRTPEPLSQVGTPLSLLPPTLSYAHPPPSPQIAIHPPPPPTVPPSQQQQHASSRFSSVRSPAHSVAASPASQSVVGHGHGHFTANASTTGSLAKKASKPFLGWFTRKLRKSMGSAAAGGGPAFGGQGASHGRTQSVRRLQARHTTSFTGSGRSVSSTGDGGRQTQSAVPQAASDFDSVNAQSDYGRLVANNGLRYLQAGGLYEPRMRRGTSELSEGNCASSLAAREHREQTGRDDQDEEDGGDYQSVATSLDPFPPSLHHRPSTRHQSISSSRWTPSSFTANSSSSTLDDYSTTASISLRAGGPPSSHMPYQRGRARSDAHPGFRSRDHTPDTHLRDSDVASQLGSGDGNDAESAAASGVDDDDNDEGASLRPMPPSIAPSPSPSNSVVRTIAPSIASSRSPSYAASLAPSSRGWRSVATTSSAPATPTTAVTSVDGGSTSTGRAESIIIQGPMAHIAQPPPPSTSDNVSPRSAPGPLPPALPGSIVAASSPTSPGPSHSPLRTHNRRESWTSGSFSPLLEQPQPLSPTTHPSSPLAQSVVGGGAGARPRAPSSPPAPASSSGGAAGLSRWGSVASSSAAHRPASLAASQRDGPWLATIRPTSLLSHALATSALSGPTGIHRSVVDPSISSPPNGLDPAVVLMPPPPALGSPITSSRAAGDPVSATEYDSLAPSSSFSSLSPLQAQHPYAPTHSTPHVRNNPHPSAPPNDNASLLTLASSSFFGPTGTSVVNGGTGSVRTGGGSIRNGTVGGRNGYAPSIVSASIRRGVERAESISFSLTGPGYVPGGGGGTPGTGRRQVDDAGASVRAIRRKGSWESGESRWSAAAPSSASILGRGSYVRAGAERDSTIGLWGGPAWGGGGSSIAGGIGGPGGGAPSFRQGSILAVDVDSLVKDGSVARSVSFSFRSHADDDDEDGDGLDDVGEDGGSSRMSRRRRRSSSAHSASTGSSRLSSSADSHFSDDDADGGDLPPIILPLDPDYQRQDSDHEEDGVVVDGRLLVGDGVHPSGSRTSSRESGIEEQGHTPGPLESLAYPAPLWKVGRGIVT